jgi:hypothetical protein
MHVVQGASVVVPLIIDGLPEEIDALGQRWQRKVEFHMTAISKDVIESAAGARADAWQVVTRVCSGRDIGPIEARPQVRRVTARDLRTLIVMVDAPGLTSLYEDLSTAFERLLAPPPAHVTLYTSDPFRGIGIDDERELAERAPSLSAAEQEEVMRAMRFDDVFSG